MAQEEKLKLVANIELEMLIEGLLKAKGFTNIVTCGETSINVVVAADTLSEVQVAQILDIVRRESGETAENIKIIPVVS
jgi:stage III sporulation protein AH